MSEDSEEACLVRPHSPSLTGPSHPLGTMQYTHGPSGGPQNTAPTSSQIHTSTRGSQSHESESGELIDYNDEIVMSQFHADAIKQAGCGKFQLIAALVVGMGLAGHAIQVYAVFYILPSAELEYCILDNEKSWLGSITLLGLGFGAFFWGGLASRAGRRKALLSCLAVSAVFSGKIFLNYLNFILNYNTLFLFIVIAAFMPTYGPFMMARFCSAAGFGGVLPAASSYICELTPSNSRGRILGLLGAFGVMGGLIAGGLAILTVPETGQMVILENKEHFSAWHRYLLLCTLPTIFSILGLFWLPESPRFLLENGREVEALQIYQKIYRNNRTRGGYSLTELELPGVRRRTTAPPSVLAEMAQSINLFCESFVQIFNKTHFKTTIILLVTWSIVIFIYHGMTFYIVHYTKRIQEDEYSNHTVRRESEHYDTHLFNMSLDNIIYTDCIFINCTFSRIFLSHIQFINCSFIDTEFTNVKTSRTFFHNSSFDEVRFIDTDITESQLINCKMRNTTTVRLRVSCDRDFDFNIYLEKTWQSHLGGLLPSVIAMLLVGELVHRIEKNRVATLCFTLSGVLLATFGFLYRGEEIVWTAGTAQGLMLAGLSALTILAVETYSTSLRCTAIGLFVCGGHIGALVSTPIFTALPVISSKFAAILSTISIVIPVLLSTGLKDSCALL